MDWEVDILEYPHTLSIFFSQCLHFALFLIAAED